MGLPVIQLNFGLWLYGLAFALTCCDGEIYSELCLFVFNFELSKSYLRLAQDRHLPMSLDQCLLR